MMVVVGLLMAAWSAYRMTTDINGHLKFLRAIARDTRPLERNRAEVAARIGYGPGVIAGVGLCGAMGGAVLAIYHGLFVLFAPFRSERLLLAAYRTSSESG